MVDGNGEPRLDVARPTKSWSSSAIVWPYDGGGNGERTTLAMSSIRGRDLHRTVMDMDKPWHESSSDLDGRLFQPIVALAFLHCHSVPAARAPLCADVP